MSMSNYTGLAWKYKWHWNRKLLSLSDSVLLKVSEMWALVPFALVLGPEVWLALSVLVSWPSMSANCSLVFSLWQSLDCEWVKEVGLLAIIVLVIELVGASSQLWSLSTETILGPETGKTIWPDWIVLEKDLRDEWLLWWIHLEHHRAFGK